MAFHKGMIGTVIALALAFTLGAPLTASAQGRGGGPPPYTPAEGARDLRSVLFNWGWHMGMLRGSEERDLIASLEYRGTGTVHVDGQPCTLTEFRISTSYQASGQRTQISCTRPNGQMYSNIEVLSGAYAWNEDTPGAELIEGQGKATPMAAATRERMIRLWASPQGALKSALAGIQDPPLFAVAPATQVPADVATAGKTSVAWEGGKPVVTFPIPGVPQATATATLDAKFMPERVVVRDGSDTTEFAYSDYRDWNNPLHPAEAFVAGRMTERRNGTVVRDITTTWTETGQMYVVMPVPASVRAAITPALQPPNWVSGFDLPESQAAATQVETPRLPDGKPDLTGNWTSPHGGPPGSGTRRCGPTQSSECHPGHNFTVDYAWISPPRYGPNRPLYKPEFWDKVQELDMWTNKFDPVMTCQPLGNPRQGPPRRIVHTEKDIIFLYGMYGDYGGGNAEHRVIPTDGREHNPNTARLATYYGYTVGDWEGDTLVLKSISFVDSTWLGRGGLFHSGDMRITERLTRRGNEILYEVTVEDPESFLEPWVMTPRIMRLATGNDAGLIPERANCEVYETGNITTQLRH